MSLLLGPFGHRLGLAQHVSTNASPSRPALFCPRHSCQDLPVVAAFHRRILRVFLGVIPEDYHAPRHRQSVPLFQIQTPRKQKAGNEPPLPRSIILVGMASLSPSSLPATAVRQILAGMPTSALRNRRLLRPRDFLRLFFMFRFPL